MARGDRTPGYDHDAVNWGRYRTGILCAFALAAIAGWGLPATAMAKTSSGSSKQPKVTLSSPVTRGSGYLALGDSVTFGYQEATVTPSPDYNDPASFLGYPEQIGTALHLKVTNLACPGETSASLINDKAPTLACENAYRKDFPLHVKYSGSQLAFAVSYLKQHKNVRLVSLMIGANDLFLCQETTPDGCMGPGELQAALAKISANVKTILSTIRKQAHYGGQIAIVNYYSLNYASPTVNSESQELNHALDTGAAPFHVRIADGYGQFQAASVRFGNSPCLAGLITQTGAYGTCGIHPSYAGQALLAKALTTAIKL
jgi:lysophospholipase L1-like esterase